MSLPADLIAHRTDDPKPEDYQELWALLRAYNVQQVGHCAPWPFAVLLRDPHGMKMAGGVWGFSLWGSFYVDMLVAPDGRRGQGLGGDLLDEAEVEARNRGCHIIWLDTFAFQARPFYEARGYREFGRLNGPTPMFPRFFMVKDLQQDLDMVTGLYS